ncbi:C4-dicarboxylate ABC transporter [Anopheles sinensis]|uniref:C4-dicarboxylate ABC transporter n=1 Tax=Anopheles sinensis TaxID=74873 RepID=A0A084VPV0_ANOSI|nr:C4-dicarboxylate ABC transporter [Anopheles sinensis]
MMEGRIKGCRPGKPGPGRNSYFTAVTGTLEGTQKCSSLRCNCYAALFPIIHGSGIERDGQVPAPAPTNRALANGVRLSISFCTPLRESGNSFPWCEKRNAWLFVVRRGKKVRTN